MPPKAPPLKLTETLENTWVVGSTVNDPETVEPEVPVSLTFEKLQMVPAEADSDAKKTNIAQMPEILRLRPITNLFYHNINCHESIPVERAVKPENCCNRLQALATSP